MKVIGWEKRKLGINKFVKIKKYLRNHNFEIQSNIYGWFSNGERVFSIFIRTFEGDLFTC